jgi:hypothetical protein
MLFGTIGTGAGNAFPMPPPAELLPLNEAMAAIAHPLMLHIDPPTLSALAEPNSQVLGLLLSLVLSTLAAFNMAIWRHLRRAYVEGGGRD